MSNRPSSGKPGHPRPSAASRRVSEAQAAGSGSRIAIAVGIVILVVGVAMGIAFVASRSSEESGAPPAGKADLNWSDVKVVGTALAPAPDSSQGAVADTALGQAAPGLEGKTFDGSPLTIPATGRPKVVMFVAHWCPHCQKEVPVITEHLNGKLPADVDLYAVSTGVSETKPNFPPGKWLRKEKWPVPTLVDDANGTAGEAFGLTSFPFFVAVDANGKVVARTSGELSAEQFDALLAAAKAGAGGTATATTGSSPAP